MAEAIITLPDGRRAKLTGPSREAIQAKARQLAGQQTPQQSGVLAASGKLQRDPSGRVVGNTMETPKPSPKPVSGGSAFQRGILERMAGNVSALPGILQQGLTGVPNQQLDNPLPSPSGPEALSGILAGTKSAGNVVQGQPANLGENFQASMAESQRTQQEQPFMHGLGGLGGDALSLLGGRAPMTRMGANRTAQSTTDIIAPKLNRLFEKAIRSGPAEKMARVAGRSLEGGVEGAALAMLQDGDPAETAAYAAGSQAAGMLGLKASHVSGVTDLFKGNLIKGGAKLGATAFAVGSLIQFLKSATPGGRDFILESIETGFDKIPLALTLGALSGMTGAGRVKGGQMPLVKANMPGVMVDAFSTLPRGAMLSWIRDALNDETGDTEKALNGLMTNPQAFTQSQLKSLQSALDSGDLSGTVRSLSEKDERFREILDAPDPRLAGVPLKEDDED